MKFLSQCFRLPALALAAVVCGSAYGQINISWVYQFPPSLNLNAGWSVAVAPDGVYVAGGFGGAGNSSLAKLDFNGNLLWTTGVGSDVGISPAGVTATASHAYVTYDDNCCGSFDFAFLGVYGPGGGYQGGASIVGTAPVQSNAASAAADGVYVAGSAWHPLPGQTTGGSFVIKYDPNGNELWTSQFGVGIFDKATGVQAAPDGVYVVGSTIESLSGQPFSGGQNIFVRKYDPAGNELWTREFGPPGADYSSGVSVTADGVYVTGQFNGFNGNLGNNFLQKYDLAGNELWTQQFSPVGVPNGYDSIATTASAEFVLYTGPESGGYYHSFLTEFDPNGNQVAVTELDVPNQLLFGGSIAAGPNGIYLVGSLAPQCVLSTCNAASENAFLAFLTTGPPIVRPSSHILPLPPAEPSAGFTVQWTGTDSGGPGIQSYTIYVSDNGKPYYAWLTNTSATSAAFTGASLHTYGFFSIARDTAGTYEPPKSTPDATTQVADLVNPVSHVSALPPSEASPNFLVQWSGTDAGGAGIAGYSIYIYDYNTSVLSLWLPNTPLTQAWYPGFIGHSYGFFSIARDLHGNQEPMKSTPDATTSTPPGPMAQDVNHDGQITCADVDLVKASFGQKDSPAGSNRADVNKDGVVNVLDLALVTQKLIPGTTCP